MARAKRTDRAAARRRHRAALVEPAEVHAAEAESDAAPNVVRPSRSGRPAAVAQNPSAPARPGIFSSFRSSFRPIDIRGDLAALPDLVRTRGFLAAIILSGLSVALVPFFGLNGMTYTFYQYFSGAAPLGASFLVGFFAPRASYLLGALVGIASVGFQALAFSGHGNFGGLLELVPDPATGAPLPRDAAAQALLSQAFLVGVVWCGFFASAAAWYRRFLRTANPSRQARPSASARRPDGRVAKRNEGRPILARRR
ncbi:MAG TPA: hypothetical protein VFP22_11170 [Candidatus Limnocylindrales bacterium]|nr:hypothetical protein [Candidatus Limnocylindrales bacterium]